MKLVNELLDYSKVPDANTVYIFTGNAYVRKDGALVMGRGAAKQVRDMYPSVQYELGALIQSVHTSPYGVVFANSAGFPIGVFQVKEHFKQQADLTLIDYSCKMLTTIATQNNTLIYHMNYPGVGNGGLAEQYVQPLLETLPDNVVVYK